ncbi:uncharacterized protein LOC119708457 [Motacilla alba alba]|uniref:uncharacterized protein LOC119708457 n=1 Tax=Motacilla alba alba TaxID=1094192 RepID=UPI0018D51CF9|nr:uncharacterized protein LOC119708457 [Motacilla alba alba]
MIKLQRGKFQGGRYVEILTSKDGQPVVAKRSWNLPSMMRFKTHLDILQYELQLSKLKGRLLASSLNELLDASPAPAYGCNGPLTKTLRERDAELQTQRHPSCPRLQPGTSLPRQFPGSRVRTPRGRCVREPCLFPSAGPCPRGPVPVPAALPRHRHPRRRPGRSGSGHRGGRRVSQLLVSIVVSIPACHAGDRGSIPRRGELRSRGSFFLPRPTRAVYDTKDKRRRPPAKIQIAASPSGNRTPVSRVTGGDTHHYTNEDLPCSFTRGMAFIRKSAQPRPWWLIINAALWAEGQ